MSLALTRGIRCSLLKVGISLLLATPLRQVALSEETPSVADQAAKEESQRLLLERAQRILVKIGEGAAARKCELKEIPLIHYSDQVRRLPESSLWVWQLDGVPTLFCKVERVTDAAGATQSWQYCCVPATSQKVDVEWFREFRWRAKEFPFKWIPLKTAPEPRAQAAGRLSQMKSIVREFSGETETTPTNSKQAMRLLASPLHRFAAAESNVLDGAVFGLTCNGTNPDALVIVEALVAKEAGSAWRYAIVGMTGDAVEIRHAKTPVWTKPYSDSPGDYRSWMWYVCKP